MDFNYVDALLVLIILLSVFLGWQRGFILGLFDLARWIGSLLAAFLLYQPIARLINSMTGWESVWSEPLSFIFIVVATRFLIQYLGARLLKSLSPDVHKRRINRIFGTLPGFVNGFVTAAIVSTLLFSIPFSGNFQENLRASRTANQLADFAQPIETALTPIFEDAIDEAFKRQVTTINPESNERAVLPFKVENTRPRPELETEMLQLVNQERLAQGLSPLEADPELTEVARKHSADMFARSYFAHNTPENKSPFDRMRESEVRFRTAGENLALAPTLKIAHTGLMNSPGHRANILHSRFGRVGIGILDSGRHGLMVTQNFRN
ncbi:MAG: CvpA family protein [Acidobacteria bacterium]|nr:CvpA family protein [Acidobacteriota bacterium]